MTAEEQLLQESRDRKAHWKCWGPYLSGSLPDKLAVASNLAASESPAASRTSEKWRISRRETFNS